MPIYEYYCRENHTIYQFYAKTLAQGRTVPPCPDNPQFKLEKRVTSFAVRSGGKKEDLPEGAEPAGDAEEEARLEAAMQAMEGEFSSMDENDPKAMARMMRRMSELTGEKLDGQMEEVVRKMEEGMDPEALEDALSVDGTEDEGGEGAAPEKREARYRFRAKHLPPRRDPQLYDYPA